MVPIGLNFGKFKLVEKCKMNSNFKKRSNFEPLKFEKKSNSKFFY